MFDTHKLNEVGFSEVKIFKGNLATTVGPLLELLPDGRDKSIFITKIEEAVFFGTRALAAKPENHTEVITY